MKNHLTRKFSSSVFYTYMIFGFFFKDQICRMVRNKNGIDLNSSSVCFFFIHFFFTQNHWIFIGRVVLRWSFYNFQYSECFMPILQVMKKTCCFLRVGPLARLGHCANSRKMIPVVETV